MITNEEMDDNFPEIGDYNKRLTNGHPFQDNQESPDFDIVAFKEGIEDIVRQMSLKYRLAYPLH